MTKRLIIQDMLGKYYTKSWRSYWSADINDAYGFDTQEEILNEFIKEESVRYEDASLPLKEITIYKVYH